MEHLAELLCTTFSTWALRRPRRACHAGGGSRNEWNTASRNPLAGACCLISGLPAKQRALTVQPDLIALVGSSMVVWSIVQRAASGQRELAFPGNPLERFRRTLDPVLAIIAVAGQLTDHLISAARGRTRNIARSEVHGRSNREFVLQRPLHHTTKVGRCCFGPVACGRLDNHPERGIARANANWPASWQHGKFENPAFISGR